MNIKVDFDNIVVKEDKNDFNVKVLMLKGEKGDKGDGEPNVIEKVQVNGTNLPVTNKTVNVPVPTVDSTLSSSSTNPVQNNTIYNALSNKADTSALDNYYEISEVDGLLSNKADNSIVDKKPYYFDNVASMKAYNLEVGDYAITKGYFSANDGGEAFYYITNIQSNSEYQENLNNNLYAELIPQKEISSIVFGDPLTSENDSTLLQKIFNYASSKKLQLKLRNEKTYNIGTRIKINSNLYLDLNNSTFKMNDNTDTYFLYNGDNMDTQTDMIENITIKNGTFDGNSETNYNSNLSGMVLILYYGNNVNIENLIITDCERNPFNIWETSNINFTNIKFNKICKRQSSYITGGNYCISIENRDNLNKGYNCNMKNITLDDCGGHFIHVVKYSFCNCDNLNIINSYDNPLLSNVTLTFTQSNNCNFNNINVDNAYANFCEINQGSKNIYLNNIEVTSSTNGFIFGPNTDTTKINSNIYLSNIKITSSNYAVTYTYSTNTYVNNCLINGKLGGAGYNEQADKIYFSNCNITTTLSALYIKRRAVFYNCIINDIIIKLFDTLNRTFDVAFPYILSSNSNSQVDISLFANIDGALPFNLKINSYNPSSTNQNYQALYLYNYSSNNSDIGTLSTLISSIGSTYRVITPSLTERNKIDIATTSNTQLKGYLHLYT